MRIQFFQTVIDKPTHHRHLGSIPQGLTDGFNRMFQSFAMNLVMTRFTQSNQVIRAISTYLTANNMVNIKNLVLLFAFASLTGVTIPIKDIFTHIPET